jgi:hypothetical protein
MITLLEKKDLMTGSCMDRSGWNRPALLGDCEGLASVFGEAIIKSKVLIKNKIRLLMVSFHENNKKIQNLLVVR